jgi:hypothetical protein
MEDALGGPADAGAEDAAAAWPDPRLVAAILLALGIALRLRFYLASFSLEVAEAQLSLNLLSRGFVELIQPLAGDQAAPIGFLWAERLALVVFGNHELALRAFPMLSGIAALFLFYAVARRMLPLRAAQVGLLLFAISPLVIHFTNQVKQYSSDIAILLLLTWTALWARQRALDARSTVVLAGVGALAIWFSHPAIFVLAGIGLTWTVVALRGRETGVLGRLVLCGVIWLASFGALYQVSLRSVTGNAFLLEYWSQAFMPLPPRSLDDLKWFPTAFFSMFRNPGGFVEPGLGAALFLIGLFALARRDAVACAVLVLPMLLALLASGLGQFPFGERVILFLTPALMLLIAQGVDVVRRLTWHAAPIVTIALLGCLVFDPLFSQAVRFMKPRSFSGAREAFAYLADHAAEGEGIYLYSDSISLFRYYAPRFGLEERTTVLGTSGESNWAEDVRDLSPLRGRFWLVFTHVHARGDTRSEEDFFLFVLDRMGKRLDQFRDVEASVYLYDLQRGPLTVEAP